MEDAAPLLSHEPRAHLRKGFQGLCRQNPCTVPVFQQLAACFGPVFKDMEFISHRSFFNQPSILHLFHHFQCFFKRQRGRYMRHSYILERVGYFQDSFLVGASNIATEMCPSDEEIPAYQLHFFGILNSFQSSRSR